MAISGESIHLDSPYSVDYLLKLTSHYREYGEDWDAESKRKRNNQVVIVGKMGSGIRPRNIRQNMEVR